MHLQVRLRKNHVSFSTIALVLGAVKNRGGLATSEAEAEPHVLFHTEVHRGLTERHGEDGAWPHHAISRGTPCDLSGPPCETFRLPMLEMLTSYSALT